MHKSLYYNGCLVVFIMFNLIKPSFINIGNAKNINKIDHFLTFCVDQCKNLSYFCECLVK